METTPKLPPPPRIPQNSSAFSESLARTVSPDAVTTSAAIRLSMVRPCPAGEPADPTAHGQPGHSGAGDDPERDGEPVRLGGLVDVGERRPRLDADDPPPRVHPDRPERAQVEDHPPVHRPVAGHAVAAAADGQPQPMLAGQGHGRADVADVAGPELSPAASGSTMPFQTRRPSS